MLLITLLLGCSLFTGAPEESGTADTAEITVPHPCEVEGRAVSWVQAPRADGDSFGLPEGGSYYRLADDFVVPEADGCWCVKEVRVWGQASDGLLVYETDISLSSSSEAAGPSPTVLQYGGPAYSSKNSCYEEGQPLVFQPTNEGPGDPSVGWIVLERGVHWLSANPGEFFDGEAPFAWSAGTAPEGTDGAWVADPDQVLTEISCPAWSPWSECSPSSTARDLAFEIHATTDEAACQAWLASNGYIDESGVSE